MIVCSLLSFVSILMMLFELSSYDDSISFGFDFRGRYALVKLANLSSFVKLWLKILPVASRSCTKGMYVCLIEVFLGDAYCW